MKLLANTCRLDIRLVKTLRLKQTICSRMGDQSWSTCLLQKQWETCKSCKQRTLRESCLTLCYSPAHGMSCRSIITAARLADDMLSVMLLSANNREKNVYILYFARFADSPILRLQTVGNASRKCLEWLILHTDQQYIIMTVNEHSERIVLICFEFKLFFVSVSVLANGLKLFR